MPVLPKSLKGIARSLNRLIDDFVAVGDAHKAGFKLRRRKIDSFREHGVKKSAVEFAVALVRSGPICNRLFGEEAGPH